MTEQTFERAKEINARINMISDIISCIQQCRPSEVHSQYALASIKVLKQDGYIVKDCEIHNHVIIDDDILHDIESLLWKKYEESCEEFKAL